MSEEVVRKMLEEFVTNIRTFNDTLIRLEQAMNHLSEGQKEVASELRELRREFAALAAKIEMALAKR
jgi:predicted  nucleic acid-binding Zn-ribbon protein